MSEMPTGRRHQIRQAAQNLFREKGYAATSMRDLARSVGIEAASLYSHINSKEDILNQICLDIATGFMEAMNSIKDLDLPPAQKLEKAIIAHLGVIRLHSDASAVFLHEWQFMSEPELTRFKNMRRSYEKYFRDILEEGMQQRIFRRIDMKVALPTLFSAMNWAYEWYRPASDGSPAILGHKIFTLIFEGIKKR